jgi:hypothetical protein
MRRRAGRHATAAIGLGIIAVAPAVAAADGAPGAESVRATPAPNSERRGIRTGPVVTYLSVGVRGTYNDNIFAEQDATTADYIARVRPKVNVRTRTDRHGVNAMAEAQATRHLHTTDENIVDYGGRVSGHLDLGETTRLAAEVAAAREHEDRTSPDDPDGDARTPIDRYTGRLTAQTQIGRLGISALGALKLLDFTDVPAADGGGEINNDDRDRRIARVAGRIGYGISATYEPFLQAAYNTVDYRQARDDDGFDRDSSGFEFGAGVRYRPNGFTVAEGRVGYRKQTVADRRLGTVEGLTAEVALRSNLTPRTTLDVTGHRLVQQSTLTNASAFFATRAKARIDHAVWPNLLVGVDGSLARHTFAGIARADTLFGAGVDARYDPSAHLRLTMAYGFSRRTSTRGSGFSRNKVTLGAELRY